MPPAKVIRCHMTTHFHLLISRETKSKWICIRLGSRARTRRRQMRERNSSLNFFLPDIHAKFSLRYDRNTGITGTREKTLKYISSIPISIKIHMHQKIVDIFTTSVFRLRWRTFSHPTCSFGSSLLQQLDNLLVSYILCQREGSAPEEPQIYYVYVDVWAVEQELDNACMSVECSNCKGGNASIVGQVNIDIFVA